MNYKVCPPKCKGDCKECALEIIKSAAFDIIKDKDVNPIDIRCCDTVEQYNDKENSNVPLTKAEFTLLKVNLS